MLESIGKSTTSASRHEKYCIVFANNSSRQNKTMKLPPKTLLLGFKNEYRVKNGLETKI